MMGGGFNVGTKIATRRTAKLQNRYPMIQATLRFGHFVPGFILSANMSHLNHQAEPEHGEYRRNTSGDLVKSK
jgi:hypothetical protein